MLKSENAEFNSLSGNANNLSFFCDGWECCLFKDGGGEFLADALKGGKLFSDASIFHKLLTTVGDVMWISNYCSHELKNW